MRSKTPILLALLLLLALASVQLSDGLSGLNRLGRRSGSNVRHALTPAEEALAVQRAEADAKVSAAKAAMEAARGPAQQLGAQAVAALNAATRAWSLARAAAIARERAKFSAPVQRVGNAKSIPARLRDAPPLQPQAHPIASAHPAAAAAASASPAAQAFPGVSGSAGIVTPRDREMLRLQGQRAHNFINKPAPWIAEKLQAIEEGVRAGIQRDGLINPKGWLADIAVAAAQAPFRAVTGPVAAVSQISNSAHDAAEMRANGASAAEVVEFVAKKTGKPLLNLGALAASAGTSAGAEQFAIDYGIDAAQKLATKLGKDGIKNLAQQVGSSNAAAGSGAGAAAAKGPPSPKGGPPSAAAK